MSAASDAIREATALAFMRVIEAIDRADGELGVISRSSDPDPDVGDAVADTDDALYALHQCRAMLSVLAWNGKARAGA